MRSQPRIASLITAIGLSLLLQYGGQVFILNGSPQTIEEMKTEVLKGKAAAVDVFSVDLGQKL